MIVRVSQDAAQRCNVNLEISLLDKCFRPDEIDKLVLADQLACSLDQDRQNAQRAAADAHRLVAVQQQLVSRYQLKSGETVDRCGGRNTVSELHAVPPLPKKTLPGSSRANAVCNAEQSNGLYRTTRRSKNQSNGQIAANGERPKNICRVALRRQGARLGQAFTSPALYHD